jgi:O-succinylbenzoate synthase
MRAHAVLAARIATPVCLDESIPDFAAAVEAISTRACSVMNVKPARVGGFHAAVAILSLCSRNGTGAWIGGMLESGIGRAGCLALATHPACTHTPDLSASDRYFAPDVTEPFVLANGSIAVPRGPGLGVVPRQDLLDGDGSSIETVFER